MDHLEMAPDRGQLAAAQHGNAEAFEQLVTPLRGELYAHCYRMLGSVQDAEDALQESMLGAWQGIGGFAGRSSLRAWLYRIATNACLRLVARRPRRVRSMDYTPPRQDVHDLGDPVTEPVWLEPWLYDVPTMAATEPDPAATYLQRESVELAFAAALQHLPGTQRAVLILREVLEFSADEVANILDTTPSSVNSALQRARKSIGERVPPRTQARELAALGRDGQRDLVDAFVRAWELADVEGLTRLLADDANFTMPPLPAWFAGRADIGRFLADRMLVTPWRLIPLRTPGPLAFACYQSDPAVAGVHDGFRLGAVSVLRIARGQIVEIAGFLDPALHRHLGLPTDWPGADVRELACRWPARRP